MTVDVYQVSGTGISPDAQLFVFVTHRRQVANMALDVFQELALTLAETLEMTPGEPVREMNASHVIQKIAVYGFYFHRERLAEVESPMIISLPMGIAIATRIFFA